MLLFIRYLELILLHLPNFNTSHVTVYQSKDHPFMQASLFQYISCYCLSNSAMILFLSHNYFNTSHVTVYQTVFTEFGQHIPFQYISCYCLSRYLLPDLVPHCYFNTSHVTVYQKAHSKKFDTLKFQYISCYCLSKKRIDILIRDRKFQYISCYCLSTGTTLTKIMEPISIHLMLLFILAVTHTLISVPDFNTSHVTVYRT